MVWRTVLDNISVDGSGVSSRSLQLGQVGDAVNHTACVLGPAQDQCAGPRVPVLGGISITPTLPCVTLGNAFLPIQLKYSYLVVFSCFDCHMLIFASSPTSFPGFLIHQRWTQFLCFKGLLWPFSSLLVISFNFKKLNLPCKFYAPAQLESRYLNCKSSLTERFTSISFTDSQKLFSAECRRVLMYLLFYTLL